MVRAIVPVAPSPNAIGTVLPPCKVNIIPQLGSIENVNFTVVPGAVDDGLACSKEVLALDCEAQNSATIAMSAKLPDTRRVATPALDLRNFKGCL